MQTAFRILLDGTQQVPSVATSASGFGYAVFDDVANTLTYSISVSGLDFGTLLDGGPTETSDADDDVTAVHFHVADTGVNGAVAFNLITEDEDDVAHLENADDTRTFSGVWEGSDPATTAITDHLALFTGATLDDAVGMYLNIHTSRNPGGELRGQLLTVADDTPNTILGTPENDQIQGLGGDDTIDGLGGDDIIEGGAGADTITGGPGTNTVSYKTSDAGVTVNLATFTGSGGHAEGDTYVQIVNAIGSMHDDTLTGVNYTGSVLDGGAAADILAGGDLSDTLIGGAGADSLDGGGGDENTAEYTRSGAGVQVDLSTGTGTGGDAQGDRLTNIQKVVGSSFDDTLTGDAANNVFEGGSGADTLDGGGGNNSVVYFGSSAAVQVNLATGVNTGGDADGDALSNIYRVRGSNFDDSLFGSASDDWLAGSAGDDVLEGGAGADLLDGGAGANDTVSYAGSGAAISVNLSTNSGTGGDAEGDEIYNTENITGSAHNDTLTGDAANNRFDGGAGEDTTVFSGNRGDATIASGPGYTARVTTAAGGQDTLSGVEALQFDDETVDLRDLTGPATFDVTGIRNVGQTLTASFTDPDGTLDPATVAYQWTRDGTPIPTATNATFQLTADDIGTDVQVVMRFTDIYGFEESRTSPPSTPVAGPVDDYLPGVAAGLGAISVGGRTTGEIETAGDIDGFGVALLAGNTYQIAILGDASGNGTLEDPDLVGVFTSTDLSGPPMSSVQGSAQNSLSGDSTSFFTPEFDGVYYIGVHESSGAVGTYTVAVNDTGVRDDFDADRGTTGAVAPGGTVDGRIDFAGDNDWFATTLATNRVYEINLVSTADGTALEDPHFMGIYDRIGNFVPGTENDDGGAGNNSKLQFVAKEAGSYYLSAGGSGDATGEYQLVLNDLGVADNDSFDITINFTSTGVSDAYVRAFEAAVARWEEIIVGDLPYAFVEGFGFVDDILIDVTVGDTPLSFPGVAPPLPGLAPPVLATSDVLEQRTDASALPTHARIEIDQSAVGPILNLDEFAANYIGRALGFGSLWQAKGLVEEIDGALTYVGTNGLREIADLSVYLNGVNVLEDGRDGDRAGENWSEATLDTELMTPQVEVRRPDAGAAAAGVPDNPISALTIAAMEDLGYVVDYGAADAFRVRFSPQTTTVAVATNIPVWGGAETAVMSGTTVLGGCEWGFGSCALRAPESFVRLADDRADALTGADGAAIAGLEPVQFLLDREDGEPPIVLLTMEAGLRETLGGYSVDQGYTITSGSVVFQFAGERPTTLEQFQDIAVTVYRLSYFDGLDATDRATFTENMGALGISEVKFYLTPDAVLGLKTSEDALSFTALSDARGGHLVGGASADTLLGQDGSDLLEGEGGADRLVGNGGDDVLNGGDGSDLLNGGDGNDTIAGGETVADRRDTILGGNGDDSVQAGHGNDLVYGQDGDDVIAGGFGVDELFGQNGNDVITGSALSDLVFGGAGDDFVNGGFGFDRINGGTGADKFYHVGVEGHGSDWIQDYSAADGDVLAFGIASATPDDFQVNFTHTASRTTGERSGNDAVEEAFVIYKPTGQIIWALVDGGGQEQINIQIGGDTFDLLA